MYVACACTRALGTPYALMHKMWHTYSKYSNDLLCGRCCTTNRTVLQMSSAVLPAKTVWHSIVWVPIPESAMP